jgi:hypothetical protein
MIKRGREECKDKERGREEGKEYRERGREEGKG